MSAAPDLYRTLGVASDASASDIKKRYRELAKKYHPDRNEGCKNKEGKFKEISVAYDVLSDPKKRARYDAMRSGGFPPGFTNGFARQGQKTGQRFTEWGDLFAQMFGEDHNGHPRNRPGGPGFRVNFDLSDMITREQQRRRSRRSKPGKRPASAPAVRTIRAMDGTPLSQRGLDIYSELRLALDDAILGTVAEVSTLIGKAKVKIPSGTSSGTKLRLKHKGDQGPDGSKGDHYITVHIDVPANLDDNAKKLLAQFMRSVRKE